MPKIKEYDQSVVRETEANEPAFDYSQSYTYGDYLKFDIEEMVEIIRGKIFWMSSAPRIKHQGISGNLFATIHSMLKGKSCKVFNSPVDIVLPIENKKRNKSTTVVQPDICVICDPKIIEEKAIFGVPDFIIEIVAGKDVKKDTQIKFDLYQEAGVGEYWIVLADIKLVEVYILENGKYQRLNAFSEDDIVPVKTIPGLEISIEEIFEGV
jgi:Uma2 family endonuclease